jgi:hypothetical protein
VTAARGEGLTLVKLTNRLGGCRFHINEAVELVIREWLQMQEPVSTVTEFLNTRHCRTNASMCLGIVLKNDDTLVV